MKVESEAGGDRWPLDLAGDEASKGGRVPFADPEDAVIGLRPAGPLFSTFEPALPLASPLELLLPPLPLPNPSPPLPLPALDDSAFMAESPGNRPGTPL